MRIEKVGISGHRPLRLLLDYSEESEILLRNFFIQYFDKYFEKHGIAPILNSGFAQGADIQAAYAFMELGLEYDAYLPFNGMELKWPTNAQKKWRDLLDMARNVYYICDGGYASWKFLRRDEAVVNNSDLMFFLLDDKPEKSGTRHTYEYTVKQGIKLENIFEEWENYKNQRKT